MTRGFVPRRGRPPAAVAWSWEVALAGWTRRDWEVVTRRDVALEDPARTGLLRAARRFTKRVGHLRVAVAAGAVRTARPAGVRMGKGKGKAVGTRGWLPRGASLVEVDSAAAAVRLAVLDKRAGGALVRRRRFY